ncbi:MFS transporter [Actinokineospora enzanensis]|uniref:MFS transporter n=1 Tax=Actinokineospora enzanensis TaxID=155975 RepID=UPI0004779E3E|nr:MFS transporter [Actinokineospora enzanensis]
MVDDPVSSATRAARSVEQRGLGALYWRFWATAGLSNLADGVLKIALPLVATGFTRSPILVGGLAFAFTLPWLLFALPAGAIVDRCDRRILMLVANTFRVVVLAVVVTALLFGYGSVLALYCAAFCVGSAETIYDNAAQSVVPQLVSPARLVRANGRMFGAQLAANELLGPPLAGALMAIGASAALGMPIVLWVAAVGLLLFVGGTFRTVGGAPQGTTLRADIADGFRYFLDNRLLRTFAVVGGMFNIASSATQAILILYAFGRRSVLGLDGAGYGLLVGTIALGSLFGSFLAEWACRLFGRARTLALSFSLGVVLIVMPAIVANVYVIGVAFFAGGMGIVIANVLILTLRQQITPPHVLSRVNSGTMVITWGAKPLGTAIGSVLAELFGLRSVFVVMGVVACIALIGVTRVTDRAMDEAEQAG